ncbi:MAG: DinB family protein [Acidimicrobiia bacterium]
MHPHCTSDCGLDTTQLTVAESLDSIERELPAIRSLFTGRPDALLRAKSSGDVWSPLEYLVHLRDAVRYHGWQANLALTQERPQIPAPDPDAAAVNEAYNDADPAEALMALEQQTARFVSRTRTLADEQLDRAVVRAGTPIDVRFMVRNVAHEVHHHKGDIERLLA